MPAACVAAVVVSAIMRLIPLASAEAFCGMICCIARCVATKADEHAVSMLTYCDIHETPFGIFHTLSGNLC